MKVFIFEISFLISYFSYCYADFSCHTHATILRQLESEGFHIDINSAIELLINVEDAAKWENCSFVLRENIPDSFYVNPDQLSELHRSGVLNACTLDKVDIESPQYLSNRHTVYVYGKFQKSHNLIYSNVRLPLHLRYQMPRSGGGYSFAEMKTPTLLVQCENLKECDHLMKSKAPCFYCSPDLCSWMRIPYKTNAQNFTIPVPVGNLDHLNFVSIMTYSLTYGGFLYIILALLINDG